MTNFSELSTRVKTATLLITALVALYVIAIITDYARWLFLFTMFAVVCVTSFEFATVCTSERGLKHKAPLYFIVCLIPALLVLVSFLTVEVSASSDDYYAAYRHVALLAASAGIFISFIITITYGLFLGRDDREVFAIVNREAPLGIFHVGFCGAILMSFVMLPNFQWLLLWLMLVVFANDIAAYFIGTKVKGPKLAPEISPNKTISGSVGAIFVATTVGIVFSYLLYLPERYTYLDISLLSAFTVIVAQLGDLSKSYLKRLYGVKDTGSILPGHGGLLDRVDGLLMSAPILYFWLAAF